MSLLAPDFGAVTLRCVFFTQGIAFETGPAIGALLQFKGLSLDGPIVSLPIPEEAPPQVPRLQMASRDGSHTIQAGPERFSLNWQAAPRGAPPPQHFVETAVSAFEAYRLALPCRLGRLALHAVRFASSPQPAMALAHHFCRPDWLQRDASHKGPLSRCENFELHAHKRFLLKSGIEVNSWMRCKTGQLESGGIASNGVVSEQDINTLSENAEAKNLSSDEATTLFLEMLDESLLIVDSYFPARANVASQI